MINKIFDFLFFLFKPSFWLMSDKYSKEWDRKLLELMDKYEFTQREKHTAKLGNNLIWISSYPHACFHLYNLFGSELKARPSRKTILRAKEKLEKETGIPIGHSVNEPEIINNIS